MLRRLLYVTRYNIFNFLKPCLQLPVTSELTRDHYHVTVCLGGVNLNSHSYYCTNQDGSTGPDDSDKGSADNAQDISSEEDKNIKAVDSRGSRRVAVPFHYKNILKEEVLNSYYGYLSQEPYLSPYHTEEFKLRELNGKDKLTQTKVLEDLGRRERTILAKSLLQLQRKRARLKKAKSQASHMGTIIAKPTITDIQDYGYKLLYTHQFGRDFIIDCGFIDQLTTVGYLRFLRTLKTIMLINKGCKEPLKLWFCGLHEDSKAYRDVMSSCHHFVDGITVNITEKSILDLFPASSLIYLTPDSREPVKPDDCVSAPQDKVFIIAALPSSELHSVRETLAKATKLGIAHRRLPITIQNFNSLPHRNAIPCHQAFEVMTSILGNIDYSGAIAQCMKKKLVVSKNPHAKMKTVAPNQIGKKAENSATVYKERKNRVKKSFKF